MKRFERLGHKPVAVRELGVEGSAVTIREGVVGGELVARTEQLASIEHAQQHADALVAQWRGEGFVPITRLAPVEREEPIYREMRREWTDVRGGRWFRELQQQDTMVRVIDGEIANGSDRRTALPNVIKHGSIREATAAYDRMVASLEEQADAAERDAKVVAEHVAMREAAERAEREEKRRQRQLQNRHPELEAQCLASPDGEAPWLVYADWLLAHADPLGEVAALAAHDVGGATRLLRRVYRELIPPENWRVDVEFRYGFVRHVLVKVETDASGYVAVDAADDELAGLVKRVLLSPACRFVDSLQLGLARTVGYENDWGPTLAAICESVQAPTLRTLRFDAYSYTECEISWVPYGDLAFAWPQLPSLELLHIRAGLGGNLGTLDLPNLRTFIRETGGLMRADLQAVLARPRPRLAHLELWTGTVQYGSEITLDDLQPIFDAHGLPALRHLGIVNSELSDNLVQALVASRVLGQLESLDLSRGIAAAAFTEQLVRNAPRFRHLAEIDLSRNLLRDDEIAAIRAVLDNVVIGEQRERDDDFEDDPADRYVEVGE